MAWLERGVSAGLGLARLLVMNPAMTSGMTTEPVILSSLTPRNWHPIRSWRPGSRSLPTGSWRTWSGEVPLLMGAASAGR